MTKTVIRYLLLSTFVWLLASPSVSQTVVEVEAGDTVTFSCRNVSDVPTLSTWMRAGRTSKPFVISSGYGTSPLTGRHSDGIQQSRFVTEYGTSFINLTMMKVSSSDSGWYYCLFYLGRDVVVVNSTWLLVHENGKFHEEDDPNSEKPRPVKCERNWIMVGGLFGSAVIILVLVIVGLVFRTSHQRKLQKDTDQPQLQESQGQEPELAEVCYSMLSFRQNGRGGPRPKDLDTAVVYAATRRL
ncbi:unnamed protein product [Boreogadus saida]